jgi:hypothetical protein
MKTITVVRIESTCGNGIFRCEDRLVTKLSNYGDFSDRHWCFPAPDDDTPSLDVRAGGTKWFCSFKSIEQFNKWIRPSEVKEFIGFGCSVFAIEVSEWQEGAHQIIFTKEGIIDKKNITDLFK